MTSRFARLLERRRAAILVVSAIVVAGSAVLAVGLPLRGGFADLLPDATPSVRALHVLERRVPSFGTILVAAESDDAALPT